VIFVDKNGKCLLNYRKTHLYGDYERSYFTPGNEMPPIVEFQGWKIGLLVCYEIEFVEPCRILAIKGAQLIIIPTANTDPVINNITTLSRAYENNIFLIYVNRVGPEKRDDINLSLQFCGQSVIVGPNADVLARGKDTEPCLLIAELIFDKKEYNEKRKHAPYIEDRKPELYSIMSDINKNPNNDT